MLLVTRETWLEHLASSAQQKTIDTSLIDDGLGRFLCKGCTFLQVFSLSLIPPTGPSDVHFSLIYLQNHLRVASGQLHEQHTQPHTPPPRHLLLWKPNRFRDKHSMVDCLGCLLFIIRSTQGPRFCLLFR